ncbi:acetolactate synthase [Evtepia sp.]|nr:acetolactate synthase [Candidatus Evtepia faecavium]
MVIKQISVFVENVPGKIVEVSQILGENNIDMSALSLADSSDFGILRLIVNDPEKAYQVLREHAFVVKQSEVIAAVIDDRPGGLTAVLKILAQENVSVEYMYAFVGNRQDGHAVVVLRTNNQAAAQKALDTHHISTLAPQDIYRL